MEEDLAEEFDEFDAEVEEADERRRFLLTTAPNAIVKPIHSKAMPVVLTNDDVWMRAPWMRQRRCGGHCQMMR
ncbi:putative SOS response-associated peptidase YedK [Bradyrhizobium sp. ERR14]|nr:putative SOS response-associated peptidase YedK [Bradyrhizobium sp. ERR14]